MGASITLDDIARKAGVTKAAVSEILRDHPNARRFKEETRERVRRVANELNYRPNFFASQIRAANRKLAMCCLGTLDDTYAAAVAGAFQCRLAESGYSVIVSALGARENQDFEDAILGRHGILGLAVVGYASGLSVSDADLVRYANDGVNVVTVGRPTVEARISQVVYDNDHGVEEAVESVIAEGARHIWCIGDMRQRRSPFNVMTNRAHTALALVQQHAGAGVTGEMLAVTDGAPNAAEVSVREALREGRRPDAVVCGGDRWALGAIRALTAAGLQVGRDVAVTGYNNSEFAAFITPPLTTVNIPVHALGRQAADLLLDMLNGKRLPGTAITLPVELIQRPSGRLQRD